MVCRDHSSLRQGQKVCVEKVFVLFWSPNFCNAYVQDCKNCSVEGGENLRCLARRSSANSKGVILLARLRDPDDLLEDRFWAFGPKKGNKIGPEIGPARKIRKK